MCKQFYLLGTRRFWPLFVVQFCGAFNDNFAKSVFVVLIAYGYWDLGGLSSQMLVSLAAAIFILPFVVFTPYAGHIADRFDKSVVIQFTKWAELLIVLIAVAALVFKSMYIGLFSLFLFGVQSAFFSPCKFAILPCHLEEDELIIGNALVTSGTYIAILTGAMVGAFLAPFGSFICALVIVLFSLIGLYGSYRIPEATSSLDVEVGYNILKPIFKVWRESLQQPPVVLISIFGTAWFYFVASSYHAQFANYTKHIIQVDNVVLSFFMALFSIGIAVGGLVNHQLLRGCISTKYVSVSVFLFGAFGVDFYFASQGFVGGNVRTLMGLGSFLSTLQSWRIIFDLFFIAVLSGVYVIPLRAIVQLYAAKDVRGRVVSSSNMAEAIFILLSALSAMALFSFGFNVIEYLLVVSICSFFVFVALFSSRSFRSLI